jgi:DNA-binding CsgD family transcriptional regulator
VVEQAADLLTACGTAALPEALKRVCASVCSLSSLVITEYAPNGPPRSLWHDLGEIQATIHVSFYEAGPYRLDPFYLAAMRDAKSGAYRLRDLVQEAFYKSEYYRVFFRKIGLSDELGLIIPLGGGRVILVSLARKLRQPGFTDADIASVRAVLPMLEAAVRRQWGGAGTLPEDLERKSLSGGFQSEILSGRELEIVRLVLEGHSTPSAAALLGISEGTVKVHRRHAYAKLGVSSQAELFAHAARG